jgi:anti-sigma regulatory factor (Ser/Thr protein kinase)
MGKNITENQVVRLQISADINYLPEVVSFVGNTSLKLGLNKEDVMQLELITEETCLNVIEHAFDEGEKGVYDVIIERQPNKIMVAVEDRGLPFDFTKFKPDEKKGLGTLLMRAYADEIKFLNIGRQGKRVELYKFLSYEEIEELTNNEYQEAIDVVRAPQDEKLTLRMMTEQDIINMSRCIYRSYGYTYSWEFIYYPEKVKELLKSNIMSSCIYLNSQDEIIGHFALLRNNPYDVVGESGMAVVDPRYRGRGLFQKMKLYLANQMRDRGVIGFYSKAVALHPYSQKGNVALGARETGILLGSSPSTMEFKKIKQDHTKKRLSKVLFYYILKEGPVHRIYPPSHHFSIINKIYKINGLKRELIKQNEKYESLKLNEKSKVNISVQPEYGSAYMQISEFGKDFLELIHFRLRELCYQKIRCIYIDLPLLEPATQTFCARLEKLGFFFSGVIPEYHDGDILRLQYLNNVIVDPQDIVTASEFGEELANYVRKAYKLMMNS